MMYIASRGDLTETTTQSCSTQISARPSRQKTLTIVTHYQIARADTSTTKTYQKRTTSRIKLETSSSRPSNATLPSTRTLSYLRKSSRESLLLIFMMLSRASILINEAALPKKILSDSCRRMGSTPPRLN